MRVQDKVAIVTGSGRGIGEAVALRLAEGGAKVVLCDVTDDINAVAEVISGMGRKVLAVKADVADRDRVQAMVDEAAKEFGQIDIVVNNAGINRDATIKNMTQGQWEAVINVNLKGAFNMHTGRVALYVPAQVWKDHQRIVTSCFGQLWTGKLLCF